MGFPTPSSRSFAILELVQAQGCPVIRLGRVYVNWLDMASFGPSYKLGRRISGSFRILVSLNRPPQVVGQGLYTEAVTLPVILRVIYRTRRRLNTIEPQR